MLSRIEEDETSEEDRAENVQIVVAIAQEVPEPVCHLVRAALSRGVHSYIENRRAPVEQLKKPE